MNWKMNDRFRRLYREVQKAKPNWIRYSDDKVELANIMMDRDTEVRSELVDLLVSMQEDIENPNRSDSFSELDEEIIEEGWNVIANNPELFYEAKYEKKVRSEIEWLDPFVDEAQEQMGKRIERVLSDEETKKKYRDRLTDMAESNRQRKNPFNSRGLDRSNHYHIPKYLK